MTKEYFVPRLGPDVRRTVAMPRFRRPKVLPMRLTDVVHRVLARALTNPKTFGVFVLDGRILLFNVGTVRFSQMERRWSDHLVGTYGPGVKVSDLVDDFKEYFSDEVCA